MLYFFGQAIAGVVTTSLILERSYQAFESTGLANEVHAYVNKIIMYKSFVDGLVPAILSFFLGPWSDKYGRKPLLIAAYAGSALSFLLWSILSSMTLNPWWYLLASVPPALVGGYPSLILATYCYITDITTEEDRTWHLTWQQSVIPAGQIIGSVLSVPIYEGFGYTGVFGVASACGVVATIYVSVVVPETIIRQDAPRPWCSLFDTSLIKSMIDTCVRKRFGTDRLILWCCILTLGIFMLVGEGELSIGFLFVTKRFNWTLLQYGHYRTVVVIFSAVGTLLSAKIFQNLVDKSMANVKIAIFAISSLLLGAIAKSFSTQTWHFYLATGADVFGGLSGPVVRSALSKSVPPGNAAKAFALATSMEAAIPLASGPLYTTICTHYVSYYPSPIYLLTVGFYALTIGLVLTIDRRIRKKISATVKYVSDTETTRETE